MNNCHNEAEQHSQKLIVWEVRQIYAPLARSSNTLDLRNNFQTLKNLVLSLWIYVKNTSWTSNLLNIYTENVCHQHLNTLKKTLYKRKLLFLG
jgi:hypothetical protein